ncbi:Uma2 family endonuclease [Thermoflexibacter ruber]|uniref:Endonuclease, Uma2 family (Restriction endonuclease fold) n=1 Tax=Thermoflexibacter ruber TaxID=1003 RepID=A0A1I2ADC3_9BACT|nr:Uma2 family endonuclease [Thermoflexibacter ruber]SFE41882.1 Endonuclease, Uma2 family (restriction endonuclease fold) [Thermoflexibacter ruber]
MENMTVVDFVIEPPNVEHLVTEDDTPVDNIFSEKQQRLLVDALFASMPFGDRPFVASANVGIYYGINKPAVVPDMFVSLDVNYPPDIWEKANRVYMIWQIGKNPDVVIEIVSNAVGNEGGKKFDIYANIGIPYYVVLDPLLFINKQVLNIYENRGGYYYHKENQFLERIGLGLTLWRGKYEEREDEWLRWTDSSGNLLLTGVESTLLEKQRTNAEKQRADAEKQRADAEKQRADKLAEKLKALGINPED